MGEAAIESEATTFRIRKMEKIPKYERLMNLVACLLKSRVPVAWSRIRGTVVGYDDDAAPGTIRRRFERDKDELRAMGVPVRFLPPTETQDEGYTIERDECFLPPLDITPEEALALSCLSGVGKGRDLLLDGARSALMKLRASEPAAFGKGEESLLLDTGLAAPGRAEQNLNELRRAVLERKTVQFRYRSLQDSRPRMRTVDPYGMALFEGRWYLVGRSHRRDALRVWNIERIAGKARRLNGRSPRADFEPPEDFRVEDYVGLPGWLLYRGRKRVSVRIWFHPDVAWMIAESAAASGDVRREKFTMHKDGSGVLEVKMADPRTLVTWALKFKEKAEILSPPELREVAARVLTEMLEAT